MAAKWDERRKQKSWRKVHFKLLLLGESSYIPERDMCTSRLPNPAANWWEVWLPSQTPSGRRPSVPLLCGRCSVSNHSGHMPTSFVIASSCKWWHTACIARCQWPSTLHWQLVGSKEAEESQFLSYLWWSWMKGKDTQVCQLERSTKASIKNTHTVHVSSNGPDRHYGLSHPHLTL